MLPKGSKGHKDISALDHFLLDNHWKYSILESGSNAATVLLNVNDSTFPWEGKHIILVVVSRWLQSEGKRQQQLSVLTFFVWEQSLDIQYWSFNPNVRTWALNVNDSTFPRKVKLLVLMLVLQMIICPVERHASKTFLSWSLCMGAIPGHTQCWRLYTKLCVWLLKWNDSAFTWEGRQLATDYKVERGGKCQQDFSVLICSVWEQSLDVFNTGTRLQMPELGSSMWMPVPILVKGNI